MRRILLRMLQDGSRMFQDGSKDHPGDFSSLWHEGTPGCSRMARGCSRMVLRIILGILPRYGVSDLQDARGWLEDAP